MSVRMLSICLALMLAITIPLQLATTGEDEVEDTGLPEWTFMVYLDADNNLEGAGVEDFNEMETLGSTDELNIVVQFDRIADYDTSNGDWEDCNRYLVIADEDPESMAQYEEGENMWPMGEINMGDPHILADFIIWSMENFPADHYFLDLWDHGGAFWGACWDDTEDDFLSMNDISIALDEARSVTGNDIDIVGFDACFMAQMAVQYQLEDYCDYGIGSGFTEPGDGWPYEKIFEGMGSDPHMTPEALSTLVVDTVIDSYTDRDSDPDDSYNIAMGAFDMSNLEYAVECFSDFGKALSYGTPTAVPQTYFGQLAYVRSRTKSYDMVPIGPFDMTGYCMYDVIDFMDKISTLSPASNVFQASQGTITELRAAITDALLYSRANNAQYNAHAFTFYFPSGTQTVYDERYDETRMAQETYWDEFLHNYESQTLVENTPPKVIIEQPASYSEIDAMESPLVLSGKASDIQGAVLQVEVSVDGSEWEMASGLENWEFIVDVSETMGNHTIKVRAFDGEEYSPEKTLKVFVTEVEEQDETEESTSYLPYTLIGAVAIVGVALYARKRHWL